MNDYSDSTTKLFGPLKRELESALRDKNWPLAEQTCAKMQRELLALQCVLIVKHIKVDA